MGMSIYTLLIGLVIVALLGAATGIRLAETPSFSRRLLPFSGGLLVGVALFWVFPEIAARDGWLVAMAGLGGGAAMLFLIDRYLYPVCPTCSHTHAHENCAQSLHGFAGPLLIASAIHSFFDGWSLAVSDEKGFEALRIAFLAGIAVHKLPEGLALGALLLAALGSPWNALLGAAAAQSMMLAGGALGMIVAPRLSAAWSVGFLSIAAGAFVYLGYHAIESVSQQRGIATSVMPALTGLAGAAALRSLLPGI
jgi:zinc transporter ZupT